MENTKNVSKNIKHLLKTKGKTQRELASYLGIDEAQLSRWLNKSSIVKISTLYKCADFFNCDIKDFFE